MDIDRNGSLKIGWPECNGKFITYPCYVEAKLDGELGIYEASTCQLHGKRGRRRWNFPVITHLDLLAKKLNCNYIFGELHYKHGLAGDLYRLLSNYKSDDLKFTVFDFDSDETYEARRTKLTLLLPIRDMMNNDCLKVVALTPAAYCTDKDEYQDAFRNFTEVDEYEGVVCKSGSHPLILGHNAWVKVKKKSTADLLVVSADPTKERIGLGEVIGKELCGAKVPGMSPTDRVALVGKIVEVEYLQKMLDSNGKLTGLRNPIFKRVREDKTEVSLR
jgi:hypothetical protein